MQKHLLYDANGIQWYMFGRDPEKSESVIDTNEYLIISHGDAMLLDPGGMEIFPNVLTAVSGVIEVEKIKSYLCSHQDPDIMSSLPLWLGLTPTSRIYLSWLWTGFVSHFGHEFASNFHLVPDEGEWINLGKHTLQIVPAHHCHSSGNLHLFDPESRILFSGDMGAALIPDDYPIAVEDFDKHIPFMQGFHQRWMPSNDAKNIWVERVRRLNPSMICPQHGSIFVGEQVKNFLNWIEDLEVGRVKKYA
ncbi:MAG: MBL fold metallo-hydrolase [Oligoflexus sp.]